MEILILGDVVGSIGCNFLLRYLSEYKKNNNIDIVIANGENSADGNGISLSSVKMLLNSGVDVITTGNHIFKQPDYKTVFDNYSNVIRPANYSKNLPGCGYYIYNYNNIKICVINLLGLVYMPSNYTNPFNCADKLLSKINANVIIIDLHAEATAEKLCLAYYLDSKITALFGTHTHVQTADEQILPKGTGYITDIGMVGPINSVLGVSTELAITKMKTGLPVKFKNSTNPCKMNGIILSVDETSYKAKQIKRINYVP